MEISQSIILICFVVILTFGLLIFFTQKSDDKIKAEMAKADQVYEYRLFIIHYAPLEYDLLPSFKDMVASEKKYLISEYILENFKIS